MRHVHTQAGKYSTFHTTSKCQEALRVKEKATQKESHLSDCWHTFLLLYSTEKESEACVCVCVQERACIGHRLKDTGGVMIVFAVYTL